MSDEHKKRMKACFDQADTSGDGSLSIVEVRKVMQSCGCKLSDPEIATLFNNDDADQDRKLSFDEFWDACCKRDPKTVKEEELRAVFQDFDKDKSGFITQSELRSCLCGRAGISDEDVESMIDEVDKNNDDKVNFEEFLIMWKSK